MAVRCHKEIVASVQVLWQAGNSIPHRPATNVESRIKKLMICMQLKVICTVRTTVEYGWNLCDTASIRQACANTVLGAVYILITTVLAMIS